ncbi:RNA polymerase sigma factor [Parabacteroides pacaensis]|uniref:RNA polymerase sigma factor n=1 Tax=Parabacteroides pacaensis TaxID=2086575 RepID=UPI000D114D89|nr:sigma-70 family RNA polymerase sigma factor [Parabacteroides pacaensis]
MELEKFKITVIPLREELLNYSRKILEEKADAEDIVQEAFLKLWHIRHKLDEYRSIEALARHIVKNLCIDFLRAKKFNVEADILAFKTGSDTPESQLERKDAIEQVRFLIKTLPSLQQTIIRMKDIEGYELSEIAQITGTHVEAVRVNLSRARKKVRDQFLKLNR